MLFTPIASRILRHLKSGEMRLPESALRDVPRNDALIDIDALDLPVQARMSEEYDLSYQDALLDSEVRQYFKIEYENDQPPSNSFEKVLARLEVDVACANETRPRRPILSPGFVRAIYKALSLPLVSRMVPGSAALMLIILLMGSNVSQLLRGTHEVYYSDPVDSSGVSYSIKMPVSVDNLERRLGERIDAPVSIDDLERRLGERIDAPPDYPPGPDVLDPFELKQPRQRHNSTLQQQQRQPVYLQPVEGPQ